MFWVKMRGIIQIIILFKLAFAGAEDENEDWCCESLRVKVNYGSSSYGLQFVKGMSCL